MSLLSLSPYIFIRLSALIILPLPFAIVYPRFSLFLPPGLPRTMQYFHFIEIIKKKWARVDFEGRAFFFCCLQVARRTQLPTQLRRQRCPYTTPAPVIWNIALLEIKLSECAESERLLFSTLFHAPPRMCFWPLFFAFSQSTRDVRNFQVPTRRSSTFYTL